MRSPFLVQYINDTIGLASPLRLNNIVKSFIYLDIIKASRESFFFSPQVFRRGVSVHCTTIQEYVEGSPPHTHIQYVYFQQEAQGVEW